MAAFLKSCRISRTQKSSVIDYREYELLLPEYLRLLLCAAAGLAVICLTFYKSLTVFLCSLPLALLYPFLMRRSLCEKRKHALLLEFRDALGILTSYLSAGYSVENAFQASVPDLRELFGERSLMLQEFVLIIQGLRLSKNLETLLLNFAERSGLDDVGNFAEVFIVARKSGGELTRILQHTSDVIRDKLTITEEILTMNASKRYEQRIMNLVPFLIILYMNFSSPDFFHILYDSLLGRIVMTACLGVYLAAVWLADRIMRIEV